MLKELIQSLKPKEHLPKAFKKCDFCPINRQKVLDRLPSILESQEIARNIDNVLRKKLEVRRIWRRQQKKPRGQKVPAGQSYTEAAGDTEDTKKEEVYNVVEEDEDELGQEDDVEEEGADKLPDLDVPGPSIKSSSNYVVAVYEGQWFLAEICGDQKNMGRGYTPTSAIW
jgi:hypothetical protein